MITPMTAVTNGLQVMPHVDPIAWLASESPRPPTSPTTPKMRYRSLLLIPDGICHQRPRRKLSRFTLSLLSAKFVGLTVLLVCAGCSSRETAELDRRDDVSSPDAGPVWAPLPRSQLEAEKLIASWTRRKAAPEPTPELTVEDVLRRLEQLPSGELVVGHRAVVAHIDSRIMAARREGRDAFILFGSFHDSAGQIRAFGRLLGPNGVEGFTHVVIEQFSGDGHWSGVAANVQAGDNQNLERALTLGNPTAWQLLERRQREINYTAWRYDALHDVMALLPLARAASLTVIGCDMPARLQQQAQGIDQRALDRLRELHCLFSLNETRHATEPRGVAMFWGAEHIAPENLRRFLPTGALAMSILLVGHRPNPLHLGGQLSNRLALNAPVLIPIDPERELHALLLPDIHLGGDIERSRVVHSQGSLDEEIEVIVDIDETADFATAGSRIAIDQTKQRLKVRRPPTGTTAPFTVTTATKTLVGNLETNGVTRVELSFSNALDRTRIVYFVHNSSQLTPRRH